MEGQGKAVSHPAASFAGEFDIGGSKVAMDEADELSFSFRIQLPQVWVPTTWTILEQDCSNHLDCDAMRIREHHMALITSDCVPFSASTSCAPTTGRTSSGGTRTSSQPPARSGSAAARSRREAAARRPPRRRRRRAAGR